MTERTFNTTILAAAACALAIAMTPAIAAEGVSKADKYFAKAAEYEAQGNFEKADKYRAKAEQYSGMSDQTKAARYAAKATRYAAAGDYEKAAKYAAKAERYAGSESQSKADKYAAKAARYLAEGNVEKAAKYAAKAEKYATEDDSSKSAKYAAKAARYLAEGHLEKAAKYAAKAEKYADEQASSCWAETGADFHEDGYTVDVASDKDLSNVVLLFADGTTQRFENFTGQTATVGGTDAHTGQLLTGVWVKSGCNHSGDGPGYGEFFENVVNTTQLPVVSINHTASTIEGPHGAVTDMVFTISLSEMVPLGGAPVTVDVYTTDGLAIGELDYIPAEATIEFMPGDLSVNFSVVILGDSHMEINEEDFFVELSNPVNALLGNPLATGWIQDDDGDF